MATKTERAVLAGGCFWGLGKLRRPAISGKRNRSIKIIWSAFQGVTPATSLVRTGSCRGETQRDVECKGLRNASTSDWRPSQARCAPVGI